MGIFSLARKRARARPAPDGALPHGTVPHGPVPHGPVPDGAATTAGQPAPAGEGPGVPEQGAQAADVVARLRDAADSRLAHPRRFRAAQLRALERMLGEHEAELTAALASDLGKSATEARLSELDLLRAEIDHAQLHLTEWMEPRHVRLPLAFQPASARIEARPLGLVLVIGAWNYPVLLLLGPLVSALAAGNCAVLKPSEVSPATSALLARLVPEYLDRRAVAVVQGGANTAQALLEQHWNHIFYTGGERVGRVVAQAAAARLTPVTLELGGKSPAVVVDGNFPAIARRLALGKFMNAGQTCVAPDYVLAVGEAAAELERHLPKALAAFYGKDPATSRDYGRIVNAGHFARLSALLAQGRLICGGSTNAADRYIEPTVLCDVDPASPLMTEEIFGPILPIVRVGNFDEAVRFVNSRPAPLAAYLFSEKPRLQNAFADQVRAGGIAHNVCGLHLAVPGLPFGGVGASGMGNYHGKFGFDTFSQQRPVLAKTAMVDTLRPLYPPYGWVKRRVIDRL